MLENVAYLTGGGRVSNILLCRSATVLLTSECPMSGTLNVNTAHWLVRVDLKDIILLQFMD